jgi:hypothetical protein
LPNYNLTGAWNSDLGSVNLKQSNDGIVEGELILNNGAIAFISGEVVGNKFSFRWGYNNVEGGAGILNATDFGNTLTGQYSDFATNNTMLWNLTRQAPIEHWQK